MFYNFSNAILTAHREVEQLEDHRRRKSQLLVANFLRFQHCRGYSASSRSAFLRKAGKNKPRISIKQPKPLQGVL